MSLLRQKRKSTMKTNTLKNLRITELLGEKSSLFFPINPIQMKKIILLSNNKVLTNGSSIEKF